MQYLRGRQYYIDLYDLLTIKECIRSIEVMREKVQKDKKKVESFKLAGLKGFIGALGELILYFKKGEEYRNKDKTISEWIVKDKEKQEKYDNTREPNSIFCDDCNWAMELDGKSLHDFSDEPVRILFFFRCPKCHKGKGVFEDGEIFRPIRPKCPKCGDLLSENRKRKGEVITTIETCECGYKNKDVWDLKADEIEHKKNEAKERRLLETFREMFCLSKEEGDKYVSQQIQTESLMRQKDEETAKKSDPRYQKAMNLKKLKVNELQKVIQDVTASCGFENLNFEKPEIDKYVIISFNVQEAKTDRSDYDSCQTLRRALTKALEATNWRLMSDGVNSRLGLLYGRIKGYEREDELMKIA